MLRPFGLALLAVATLAAACHKTPSNPAELNDPNAVPHPGGGGGGGDGGGASEGGTTDGGVACGEAPTILAGFVPQRVLFVAPDGNDTNDGASRSTAWRSLANLAAQLQPGDRVDVAAGNYDCNAEIGVKGTAQRPVWIRSAEGPLKAVFNCGGAAYGFHVVSASFVVIDGFDVSQAQVDGVRVESGPGPTFPALADDVVVENSHIHGVGAAGVHVTQATNVWVFQNEIDTTEAFGPNAGGQGIDLVAVSGARVVANSVHDIHANVGIQARGGATDTRIAANLVTNVLEAFHLGGLTDRPSFLPADSAFEAQGLLAHSNVVTGATSVAFAAYGCSGCTIANNTVYVSAATQPIRALSGNTGASASSGTSNTIDLRLVNDILAFTGTTPSDLLNLQAGQTTGFTQSNNLFFMANGSAAALNSDVAIGGTGTIVDKDPLFTNVARGDFSLAATSPARAAGIPVIGVHYAYDGACRVTWNIGAH